MSHNEFTGARMISKPANDKFESGWDAIWGKPKVEKVSDVLADPEHEGHEAAKEMMAKLESGKISLCGCLGPMYGEPYCPCKMTQMGLDHIMENNPLRIAEDELARLQWESFDWSVFESD